MASKIKFSHKYKKLLCGLEYISDVKLIEVIVVDLKDLSQTFLNYDTDNGTYKLPVKGKYMMLLFQKWGTPHLFTTLRRWTEEKEKYYRGNIGYVFDVEYTEEAV